MAKPEDLFLQDSILSIFLGEVAFAKIGDVVISMPSINESDAQDILCFAGHNFEDVISNVLTL